MGCLLQVQHNDSLVSPPDQSKSEGCWALSITNGRKRMHGDRPKVKGLAQADIVISVMGLYGMRKLGGPGI